MGKGIDNLMKRARAGDPASYEGDWEVEHEATFADREPEVLVSRSLRVSVTTYEQVRTIAAARSVSPSGLMRQWIEDGVASAQDEGGAVPDSVSLVDRVQTDVARLASVLRRAA